MMPYGSFNIFKRGDYFKANTRTKLRMYVSLNVALLHAAIKAHATVWYLTPAALISCMRWLNRLTSESITDI